MGGADPPLCDPSRTMVAEDFKVSHLRVFLQSVLSKGTAEHYRQAAMHLFRRASQSPPSPPNASSAIVIPATSKYRAPAKIRRASGVSESSITRNASPAIDIPAASKYRAPTSGNKLRCDCGDVFIPADRNGPARNITIIYTSGSSARCARE